ncbi:hypothetical protein [Isoptericola sp. QY 916]|uniref:hypothetical protein n=1 Tax=Isoptericola sp. QY 916 TaxID=2782570 RepID=UPI003D2FBB4E|nr:hypothetical protein [Isoptericola sp. QY 916]
MPIKAKNTKADAIAQHEAKVGAAEQTIQHRTAALEEAEQQHEELKTRLGAGDEGVTTEQFATSQANVERARILLEGSESELKRLKAGAPFLPIAADAMVEGLRDELGVTVKVVDDLPDDPGKELPVLYLVQPHAAEPARHPQPWGSLAGTVKAHFHRPRFMRTPINPKDVERALSSAAVQGTFTVHAVATSGQRDAFTIESTGVWPEMPTVPGKVQDYMVRSFADGLLFTMQATTKEPNSQAIIMGADGYKVVDVNGLGAKVIRSAVTASTVAAGIRTVTIQVRFDAWVTPGYEHRIPATYPERCAESVVKGRVGKVIEGIGRIRTADLTRESMNVGDVIQQTSTGYHRKKDRGTVSIYLATFTFEAAA